MDRLEASFTIITELIAEAGYTCLDPVETVLSIEALYDGLWLNMLFACPVFVDPSAERGL